MNESDIRKAWDTFVDTTGNTDDLTYWEYRENVIAAINLRRYWDLPEELQPEGE